MVEQRMSAESLPELQAWFEFNRNAGCTAEQLRDTLLGAGYGAAAVDRFLEAQLCTESSHPPGQLYDAEPVAGPAETLQRFWQRLDVLNTFNQLALGDRTVCIAARHHAGGLCFIPDFLSDAECHDLIREAAPNLTASEVLNERNGAQVHTPARLSEGAAIRRGATDLVRRIESRIAKLTALPVAHGEGLQILRYPVGGEYRPHFDFFDPDTAGGRQILGHGSQRVASLILYLSDVESGGTTLFPELSLAFTPLRRAALLFASLGRDGAPLRRSLHAGCPVTSGEKWIATKWLRLMPHLPEQAMSRAPA